MQEVWPSLAFDSCPADALAADDAFWQLYDSSFPSDEREPRSVILESIRKGVGFAVRARTSIRTIGLATAHLLREPPVLFLVYLAVVPEFRSRHIGATLFEKVWATGNARYSEWGLVPKGMVWEVQIPERAPSQRDFEDRRRRIDFFKCLGAGVLPRPYVQPPVDGIASVPMRLMFWPATGGSLPDGSQVSALIRAIYFEKYHAANGIPLAALEDLLRARAALSGGI
jgi:hypothetical protein